MFSKDISGITQRVFEPHSRSSFEMNFSLILTNMFPAKQLTYDTAQALLFSVTGQLFPASFKKRLFLSYWTTWAGP